MFPLHLAFAKYYPQTLTRKGRFLANRAHRQPGNEDMYDIKQEYIKTGFPGMLKKRWVYHLLFWVVMYLMFSLFDSFSSGQPFINALREQWPHFVTYMAIVYLNLSYLIPTYLSKKRFLPYLLLLLLSSIIITPF
ncbi:MAG TPA: hypothetical protein ENJ88_08895, partial [Phaeodactylibacter sp.]|nr:hypothetical protein [Phaeodactylibacter sp.]